MSDLKVAYNNPNLMICEKLTWLTEEGNINTKICSDIFVRGHYLFQEAKSFPGLESVFSPQMEAVLFITIRMFFTTRAVLKIGENHSDIPQQKLGSIQSRDAFRLIVRQRKYLIDYKNDFG